MERTRDPRKNPQIGDILSTYSEQGDRMLVRVLHVDDRVWAHRFNITKWDDAGCHGC